MVSPNAVIKLSGLCLFLCLSGEIWFPMSNYFILKQLYIEALASGKELLCCLQGTENSQGQTAARKMKSCRKAR